MDGPVTEASPHRLVNPETLPPPVGYAHAVLAAPGRVVALGGQAGHRADGSLAEGGLVSQFRQAAANVAEALRAAGGRPEDLVQLLIFTTDVAGYRSSLDEIGAAYRDHFGKHYPPMALLGLSELFDPAAVVELVGLAVIPEA